MDYLVLYIIGGIAALSFIFWFSRKYSRRRQQKKLDEIAHDILADFNFNKEKEAIEAIGSKHVPEAYRCPKCNGMLVLKEGIYGKFLGCNHYPDCDFFSLIEESDKMKPIRGQDVYKQYKESRCPKCNGVLVLREGIYGKFLGCSRYPKCKYTRSI